MSQALNYRHLYYFWITAKEGSLTRAAARADLAVQTLSTQVRELERALGHSLLKPAGRGLALTEAGRAAMHQADAIFQLGAQLPNLLKQTVAQPSQRLAVGVSDALPKLVVMQLMEPVLKEPALRLVCDDDEFEDLLADLAVHRLDVVLADRPAPPNPNLRLYSHRLVSSELAWYAVPALATKARRGFPQSLAEVPVLLPTAHAALRGSIDRWFEKHAIRPRVVGEFEDSALLKTFGASGMGVFPAPTLVDHDLTTRYGVRQIGLAEGVEEHYYAIGTEKKIQHPLVKRLLPGSGAKRSP
jgi:LysR family transcriptional regulator, transcriptional activator of nhaA